jgi:hypothetical protein
VKHHGHAPRVSLPAVGTSGPARPPAMSDILQELLEARRTGRPCALDIGADSPAEIAVSVLAEILMVLRQKSGRPLKL